MTIKAFVFDAYGTLFDVHSVIDTCNNYFPQKGECISQTWRKKQLEYAFLRQIMGKYDTFFNATKDALHYAVTLHGGNLNKETETALIQSYLQLTPYSEVTDVLAKLEGKSRVIFSNGSHDMLDPLVQYSSLGNLLDQVVSVDDIKQYKPTPASYNYLLGLLGIKREEVLFMSSNGWDIAGAKNFGFHTAWINRHYLPTEQLQLPPDKVYDDLRGILEWI